MAISDVIAKVEDYNGLATPPVENPGEYDGPLENFEYPGEFDDSMILEIDFGAYVPTSSLDFTEEYHAFMSMGDNSEMETPEENDGMATPEGNNGMTTPENNAQMTLEENIAQMTLEENNAPEEKIGIDTPEENNEQTSEEEKVHN